MEKIRILLADDHVIVREGFRALLQPRGEIEIVGEASNGRDAVKKVGELRPDIVIMDISMPILNGLEATKQIHALYPQTRIIILSMHENPESVKQSLKAGASGYIIKKSAAGDLFNAINAVYEGGAFFSPSVAQMILDDYVGGEEEDRELLSAREREVLQLVAEGYHNKEIAALLYVSVKTVEAHKDSIKKKLNLRDQTDLIKYALSKGMIAIDNM